MELDKLRKVDGCSNLCKNVVSVVFDVAKIWRVE